VKSLGHLYGEFPRRRQHERLHGRAPGFQPLKDGQGEGGSLARAGLGLADHVTPFEEQRNRPLLDGRRGLVSDIGYRPQQRLAQAEPVERIRKRLRLRLHLDTSP
jgi:hypothetical protein